jgi:hypothetical protein
VNAGKTKPTASARPDNEDPKLNLTTSSSRKRKGTDLSSQRKKQDNDGEKKGRLERLLCPICNNRHPIKEKGDCYMARPETAPDGWRERNQDRIEAFKKKSQ